MATKTKRLVQIDRRDGVQVDAWLYDSPGYHQTLRDLLPHYSSERGIQALADLRRYLDSSDFATAGFVYRVVE